MAATWGEIFPQLMAAGLQIGELKEKLESHPDPLGLIAELRSKGIKGTHY